MADAIDLMSLRTATFDKNERNCSGEPCVLCGKEITDLVERALPSGRVVRYPRYNVIMVHGGDLARDGVEYDSADPGYMGMQGVGGNCARRARRAGATIETVKEA